MSTKSIPPYHFVPVHQAALKAQSGKVAVTPHHDYQENSYSGEMRCELKTLTPAIFGAFQAPAEGQLKTQAKARFPSRFAEGKSVIIPQHITHQGKQLAILNGSSIAGATRQNLAAISIAPMLRVQEKSFSFRPNATLDNKAKIKHFAASVFCNSEKTLSVDIYPNLSTQDIEHRFYSGSKMFPHYSHTDRHGYLSELFTLQNKKKKAPRVKDAAYVDEGMLDGAVRKVISPEVIKQFEITTNHLCDDVGGHLSSANPMMKEELFKRLKIDKQKIKESIKLNRDLKNWPEGLMIFVEAEVDEYGEPLTIVSFGNNFRYQWGHPNTTTKFLGLGDQPDRQRLQVKPLACELEAKPSELSLVNAMFGMTGETDDNFKLAGKVSFNHAVEVRDATPTCAELGIWSALEQSGQPKPSAYEHYLLQMPKKALKSYSDQWMLAGRKYYLHQDGFNRHFSQQTANSRGYIHSPTALQDNNASFAKDVIPAGKTFRFSSRFRNLSKFELGGLLLSLSPQLAEAALLGSKHKELQALAQQCNHPIALKLGHGRPQGYGSSQISIQTITLPHQDKELSQQQQQEIATYYLDTLYQRMTDSEEKNATRQLILTLQQWLAIHSVIPNFSAAYRKPEGKAIFDYHKAIRDQVNKNRKLGKQEQMDQYKLPELWSEEAK